MLRHHRPGDSLKVGSQLFVVGIGAEALDATEIITDIDQGRNDQPPIKHTVSQGGGNQRLADDQVAYLSVRLGLNQVGKKDARGLIDIRITDSRHKHGAPDNGGGS